MDTVEETTKDDLTKEKVIFNIPPPWQNYISSLFLIIVFPLAPIFIVDFIIINGMTDISVQSLSITASIYFITIGFSSNNKLTLILGILGCFTFAVIYGRLEPSSYASIDSLDLIAAMSKEDLQKVLIQEYILDDSNGEFQLKLVGILCILFISIVHGIERYNRHVVLKESFFEIT